MKISVDRKALAAALSTIGRATAARSSLPILGCVLLNAEGDGKLRCEATNLDLALSQEIAATVARPGRVALPADRLSTLVERLTGETVELELPADAKPTEWVAIRCGGNRSVLAGYDPDDFPWVAQEWRAELGLHASTLREELAGVVYAAAKDDARPALAGVLWQVSGGDLTLVAADGYSLSVRKTPAGAMSDWRAIVPGAACRELLRLLADEDVSVQVGRVLLKNGEATHLCASVQGKAGSVWLASRLIEATFPAWHQIVPTSHTTSLSLERDRLARIVRALEVVAAEHNHIVCLEVTPGEGGDLGSLRLWAEAADVGEVEESYSCSVEGEGLTIAFDSRRLLATVEHLPTEAILIELTLPSRPALIRASVGEARCVLMPMHVEKPVVPVVKVAAV